MLDIFICEDDLGQRKKVEAIINKYIVDKALDMKLTLSADNPAAVLEYLQQTPVTCGLYFLDVDLQSDINGIELGTQIREMDISATIVFITTHGEMAPTVFRLKVEAMDYVLKDNPPKEIEKRIRECMDLSYERYLRGRHTGKKLFQIKTKEHVLKIPFDDILFFEVHPDPNIKHQVILYTSDSKIEFRGSLKELVEEHRELYICQKSIAVNLNKIKEVNREHMEIIMINEDILPVSRRKLPGLLKVWKQ